jgi:hypothetical protein
LIKLPGIIEKDGSSEEVEGGSVLYKIGEYAF